eukprot:TRINITY_DN908_c1_g1_i1.p1 TRINITY_DN908_c1_g1~~TRINITY_DN908_c1_g1_i1.p1  ORF type:complete len:138 (-),score=26.23 TRINITY_DN908_c1_g1_i1:206-619(-)
MSHRIRSAVGVDWVSGMFDCFSDAPTCMLTCLFPWITIAANKAQVQDREFSGIDFLCTLCSNPCSAVYFTRQGIREKYNMEEDTVGDCFASSLCMYCSTCQHHRELKNRQVNKQQEKIYFYEPKHQDDEINNPIYID